MLLLRDQGVARRGRQGTADPDRTDVTVRGLHDGQEDSPDVIGRAIADRYRGR